MPGTNGWVSRTGMVVIPDLKYRSLLLGAQIVVRFANDMYISYFVEAWMF